MISLSAFRLRRVAAAAAFLFAGASAAGATTMWEASAPGGAYSASYASPTEVGAGVTSIRGTGAANVYDNFVFSALKPGAQVLEFVFTAPAGIDDSYSAGGTILYDDKPFQWGWAGTALQPAIQLGRAAPWQSVSLALPDTFTGALHLALNFTHGANFSYEIKALSNALVPTVPVQPPGPHVDAPPAVPVPAAALLLASGLAGLGALRLRRRG